MALGISGFSLIAVTYGMARFSWGLMMPEVMEDIPFSPQVSGVIAACSYIAYCAATLAASVLVQRYGPRFAAMAAALCAAAGMLLMACALSPAMLAAGLFIAGLSAGLASPALATAVSRRIAKPRQDQANTVINAGTSAGIIFSVPVLLLVPGGWRVACALFAAMALLCLLAASRSLPAAAGGTASKSWRATLLQTSMRRLAAIAFISGMASAAWWNFGPEILRNQLRVNQQLTSLLWLISGAAGIAGVLTGPLAALSSMKQVYRLSQLAMAAPLLLLALSHGFSWGLFPAVALCGAGYVTLSGVLLVCGATAAKQSPSSGVALAFFMLAAGQVAGSVLFGQLYAQTGAVPALEIFAALSLLMMFFPPKFTRAGRLVTE